MKLSNDKTEAGGSFTSICTAMRKNIRNLMDEEWNSNMRYKIKGTAFPEAKAVVFELKDAKELKPLANGRGANKADTGE